MCGIAGEFHYKPTEHFDQSGELVLRRALQAMIHRGPDDTGVLSLGTCHLGHNRLKILDLSSAANQPMRDSSGRYALVFNGEIFNHRILRKELQEQGCEFRTSSDTEVLLHLLIRDKEKALQKLNGFFAFAFLDIEEHELIVARDRFGEKPLWYYSSEETLFFASELKGLKCFDIPKDIDIVSLSLFLQFSYIPGPHSIYSGVFKLEPGNYLHATRSGLQQKEWYKSYTDTAERTDEARVIEEFRYLLNDAVKSRMQADVPVGCFLSGGMDSSVVARIASQNTHHLRTYSIAIEDNPFLDETPFAKEVANYIGSKHEVIPISNANMLDEVRFVWDHLDEPFADSSGIAVSILSRKVKEHVTVALSGDGADELLGGYNKHTALWNSLHRGMTEQILPYLLPIIDILPESRTSSRGNKFRQLKRYARGLNLSLKGRYLLWASWADEQICEDLLTQEVSVRKGARINMFVQDILASDFNSVLRADQQLVLTNDMLTKVDSMSMLHALEVRPPFLDFRVVEFINSLPVSYKVDHKSRKILLQKTFAGDLPQTVFNRPKRGFEVPLEQWLRNELKELIITTLDPKSMRSVEFLRPDAVKTIVDLFYQNNKSEYTSLVYSLFVFEYWYQNHHLNH
ncbi:MAG: asparagine synthase (glutamine-hydrolyzing) [Flavobacteriales bacterium]|nr:asparagine synthase (glutamine-hydrolyzing) [Flavobacteriales bacterium]